MMTPRSVLKMLGAAFTTARIYTQDRHDDPHPYASKTAQRSDPQSTLKDLIDWPSSRKRGGVSAMTHPHHPRLVARLPECLGELGPHQFPRRSAPSRSPSRRLWSDGDTAIGPQGAALTPHFVAGPYTYEVLQAVSHWIPDEAPEQLDALLARHFKTATAQEK